MMGSSCVLLVLAAAVAVLGSTTQSPGALPTSNTCQLTTTNNGTEEKFDISILGKNGDTLQDNYVVLEQGSVDDRYFHYYINICQDLNGTPQPEKGDRRENVGIFQRKIVDGAANPDEDKIVGKITDAKLSSLRDNDLRYEYSTGELCNSNQQERRARIILFCADVGLGEPVFVDEVSHCDYMFVWNTCAACPMGSDIRNKCPEIAHVCNGPLSGLSTGSILLITFVVLVGFYLIVGVLYMRFVQGAKGMEQIPNLDFWLNCCENVKEGMMFCLRCGKKSASGYSIQYQDPVKTNGLDDEFDDDLDDDADDAEFG